MTPREEIEKKLSNLERVREVAYGDFKRTREILAKHELVPIDNTPFDPERCGFVKLTSLYRNEWSLDLWIIIKSDYDDLTIYKNNQLGHTERLVYCEHLPWPATHSDGVRLLQLLGLEVRT